MKKSRLLVVLTLHALNLCILGQVSDYNLISSDKLYFEPASPFFLSSNCYDCGYEDFLIGIMIDSTQSDALHECKYLSKVINDYDPNDCVTLGPSFLGDSVVEEYSGVSIIRNNLSEEISINRFSNAGEEYVSWEGEDGSSIVSIVSSHDYTSYLGISDSVKTFSFQYFNSNSEPIDHEINTLELVVSKNYGILKGFDFRDFPYSNSWENSFSLIANSQLPNENLILTRGGVFDFNEGDVFHILKVDDNTYLQGDEETIRTILTKTSFDSADSIRYSINDVVSGIRYEDINGLLEEVRYSYDTIYNITYKNLEEPIIPMEFMPLEGFFNSEYLKNYLLYRNPEKYNGRYVLRDPGASFVVTECMTGWHDQFNGSFTYYIQGLGRYREAYLTLSDVVCAPCEFLLYFEKGDEKWGDPLGNPERPIIPDKLLVFPNPTNGQIQIEYSIEILSIDCYNITGELVACKAFKENHVQNIDLQHLPAGLYFLHVNTMHGTSVTQKIVIK